MAKNTNTEDDDKGGEEIVERDTSVRGMLKEAVKEHSEEDDNDEPDAEDDVSDDKDTSAKDKDEREVPSKSKSKSSRSDSERDVSDKAKSDTEDKNKEDKGDDDKEIKAEEDKTAEKLKPPPGWTKEGKATWDKLPPDAQKSVIKREEEVSRGIAQYAQKAKAFDEFAEVIQPYQQTIQRFGVTPAQTVQRLFQWMESLAHPDANQRLNSFKELGRSFGIDVTQLAKSSRQTDDSEADDVVDPNQPPPWFQQYAQSIEQRVNSVAEQTAYQQQNAASAYMSSWAADKPHYEAVQQTMYKLLKSETIPIKNGQLDLDGAYDAAIKLHPEISAQIQQEAIEKAQAEAAEKAKKDATEKADKLAKARKAGSSIKPGAPALNATKFIPTGKPNGTGNRNQTSVRDSLRAALQEHQE